jgi:hypothetical protein
LGSSLRLPKGKAKVPLCGTFAKSEGEIEETFASSKPTVFFLKKRTFKKKPPFFAAGLRYAPKVQALEGKAIKKLCF